MRLNEKWRGCKATKQTSKEEIASVVNCKMHWSVKCEKKLEMARLIGNKTKFRKRNSDCNKSQKVSQEAKC